MDPNIEEINAVRECVQLYIDGAASGDTAMLQRAFHDTAHMYGNYGSMEYTVPIGKFIDHVASSEPPAKTGENHSGTIQSVDLVGTAGVVKVVEENYQGADFVDFFFVMKFGDTWKIVTKLFNKF